MLLEVLMQNSCLISHYLLPLKRRFRDIQIVIIMNFVILTSVGVSRVDSSRRALCINVLQWLSHSRGVSGKIVFLISLKNIVDTSNEYLQYMFLWRNEKNIDNFWLKKECFILSYDIVQIIGEVFELDKMSKYLM